MSQTITITNEDILEQVKLSCQIPEIIDGIIARKIMQEYMLEAGIDIEDEELQQAADRYRLIYKLESVEDTWKWLEKHGLSIDDFQIMVNNSLIFGKISSHLFADKIEAYFYENQLDYTDVVMYEILLDDEDLAMELYYAVKEGEMSFYEVAREYIKDTELNRKCGYLGKLKRKDLKPEISAAIFAANSPQLLKPIVTSKGVHLILLEEIIEPKLDEKLGYQILGELYAQWLEQQKDEVEVSNELVLNN
jgi:parvulin-like peptidyl-prolyl isomerase